ncbi:MAG: glycosyltransferase [Timaviella obliquedivisa GSE-PSE-MK23-08B]|nr:glycosyltransferase [Timaviella obliquedivisa GSE-PSE-MK23-08B]
MKIAFIVGHFPMLSETFILNQISGLIDRGHEVDIYSEFSGDTSKVHPVVEKYGLIDRTYYLTPVSKNLLTRAITGLQLILQYSSYPQLLLRSLNIFRYRFLAASLWLLHTVPALAGKEPYDVVHAQFGTQGFRGMLLQNLCAPWTKLIVTFRGHDISSYVDEYGTQVYDRLFKTGDFFLANCEFFRQRVIQLGCDQRKIIVHGSGIDCNQFAFMPRSIGADGKIRIATTGRLVEKKGIEYCIRAIGKLAQTYPNLEYHIVGDGLLRQSFEQLIQELGIAHLVTLHGQKNQRELIEILDCCHIFVAPSVTAADGNQDAPVNVLKEAMAMGLPVVSTLHGGIPELVEDGISGFLVPERDADALAEKLGLLIDQPDRWISMGKAGRAYVEAHYDMNQLNTKLEELYQRLLWVKMQQQPAIAQSISTS